MLETLFTGSIVFIFLSYFGYSFSLYLLSIIRKKRVEKAAYFPFVSVILTAYNEEKRIEEKLRNTLALDYPKDKIQILVSSDGSTDQTNAIVKKYHKDRVELLAIEERRGKENAQKEAVKHANGDVLVFTDIATQLDPEGLREIVANFADPSVGCVSSEDRVIGKNGELSGEGFYVRYEMWLRKLESRVNSLVGLSGSFFAARKEVCQDFSGDMQSDFRTVLNSVKLGLKGVSDPQTIGYYQDVSDESREFDRKVRTVLRGLTVFFQHLEFLNIFRYGLFSYQFFCHKLLRWLVPIFLCIALVSNIILALKSYVFVILLIGQLLFYGLALWGWYGKKGTPSVLVRIPMYFCVVNASILVAWWRYITGQRLVMWTPSER
jgi:cellulose synthase/poly-beta-1,6-N-acetylglucosamine synthase-like glycosyltransferase